MGPNEGRHCTNQNVEAVEHTVASAEAVADHRVPSTEAVADHTIPSTEAVVGPGNLGKELNGNDNYASKSL